MPPSTLFYGPTRRVIAGAVLQVLILLPGMAGRHLRYQPVLDFGDADLREVVRVLIPNGLAVGVLYGGFILDTSFASRASQGDVLVARVQDGALLLESRAAILARIRDRVRKAVPPDVSLVDELLQERREEAISQYRD